MSPRHHVESGNTTAQTGSGLPTSTEQQTGRACSDLNRISATTTSPRGSSKEWHNSYPTEFSHRAPPTILGGHRSVQLQSTPSDRCGTRCAQIPTVLRRKHTTAQLQPLHAVPSSETENGILPCSGRNSPLVAFGTRNGGPLSSVRVARAAALIYQHSDLLTELSTQPVRRRPSALASTSPISAASAHRTSMRNLNSPLSSLAPKAVS